MTQASIVRRMYDRRANDGMSADFQDYVRTEYNGDHGFVVAEITRAGRGTPATRRAPRTSRVARSVGRISEALARAFARPDGS